jgi:ethanolaminephosphotransferase
MVYIRQKNLAGLHPYKYAGVDHSLVSLYILKPFYNNVVIKGFPMSMAYVLVSPGLYLFAFGSNLTGCRPNAVSDVNMAPFPAYVLICSHIPRLLFLGSRLSF